MANLGYAPELSSSEQQILASQSLIETGETVLETGACWNWPLEKCRRLIRHIDGEELFAACCADSRGLILLMLHIFVLGRFCTLF